MPVSLASAAPFLCVKFDLVLSRENFLPLISVEFCTGGEPSAAIEPEPLDSYKTEF